jgi:uncharacterized membrane protein
VNSKLDAKMNGGTSSESSCSSFVVMIGAVLLTALLGLPWLRLQSAAVDSADWPTFFQATLNSGVHPPLFYVLYKMVLPLWGASEFGARFIAIISGSLTIPLLYELGKVMFEHRTGLLAAMLLTVNPLHVWLHCH